MHTKPHQRAAEYALSKTWTVPRNMSTICNITDRKLSCPLTLYSLIATLCAWSASATELMSLPAAVIFSPQSLAVSLNGLRFLEKPSASLYWQKALPVLPTES